MVLLTFAKGRVWLGPERSRSCKRGEGEVNPDKLLPFLQSKRIYMLRLLLSLLLKGFFIKVFDIMVEQCCSAFRCLWRDVCVCLKGESCSVSRFSWRWVLMC